MFAKEYGAPIHGINGRIIDVEADVLPMLIGFELAGTSDTSMKESKEWMRTVLRL